MYSTPFCQHQFTEEQLASLEWVVCPCGYHYRSKNLIKYATKFAAYNQARTEVEALVAEITADHASRQTTQVVAAAPAPQTVAAPARPQRQRASISVSQWLIISASVLVLIAASVFVQGARETWGPIAWLILEAVLGGAAFVGTLFSRKFSVLLSNFLAVFSAGMLMSFIMTLGTQLNFGFTEFDQEPAWYWSINLGVVSIATSLAALKFKNFGWRALSPVALTIAGILLTYGAVGQAISNTPSAFAWQIMTLSFTAIALLAQLRFLRSIKQNVDANSENKAYEEDLHKREDASLQRFGTFTTIFLAVISAGVTLVQVLTNLQTPFEPIATLSLGALWLLGSSTIDFWGTSLSRSGVVAKQVKTATWTLAYVSIGVGLNALLIGQSQWKSILVALSVTLVLVTLPRYARFVKPPMVTLTATSWSILATWALWNLQLGNNNDTVAFAIYLFGFAVVTVAADLITKSKSSNITVLVATSLSSLLLASSWDLDGLFDTELWYMGGIGTLVVLLIANFGALTSGILANRTKTVKPRFIAFTTLPVGMVAAFMFAIQANLHFSDRNLTNLGVLVAYLVWATGSQFLNHRGESVTRELQSLIAFGSAFAMALISGYDSRYTLFTGLVFVCFAVLGYGFGYSEKKAVKLQLGLGSAVVGLFTALSIRQIDGVEYQVGALRFGLLFALLPLLVAGHNFVIARRTKVSRAANTTTNTIVLLVGSALAPMVTVATNNQQNSTWVWAYLAGGLLAAAVTELKQLKGASDALQLRIASLGYLVIGLVAVWQNAWTVQPDENHLRQLVIAAAIIAVTWRTIVATKQALWSIASYAGSLLLALVAGDWITRSQVIVWNGPEMTSLILSVLLAANGFILNRAQQNRRLWLVSDIPVFVAILPSVAYALTQSLDSNENIGRLLGVGAILAAYGYWRALQSKNALWSPIGFVGAGLAASMVVQEFKFNLSLDLRGPELYSVAVLATTFYGIHVLRKLNAIKGTLVSWGVPLAVAILPSVVYSYDAITANFSDLDALQISRVITVLVVSAAALVIGMRSGNLGAASVGTAGLALSAIPNLWFRFDGVAAGSTTVELRALLLGGFIFLILAVSKQFKLVAGNSLVFIGIPTSIALAPAVLNTVNALSHPSFQAIDWWRFAIVLSVSLTLLVVGAMRELGGMFYPGFAGVLVAALPYGFKQIDGAAWLLWIILLLVAATLIWVAMRIEKMRKLGRTPAMWLRELK
ncbi:MAG: hypothetical protein RL488_1298 [Actinomycetota bacterium]|jgi:hypothetical protein